MTGLTVSLLADAGEVKLMPKSAGQGISMEKGMLSAPDKAKPLDLVPEGGWAEERYYTFRIRYAKSQFSFVTGRNYMPVKEAFLGTVELRPKAELMDFISSDNRNPKGFDIQAVEYSPQIKSWRANSSQMSLNYTMPPQTFATVDNIARWQEKEADALRHDLDQEDIRLGVAITKSHFRFFINGVFLRQMPREVTELGGCTLRIRGATAVSDKVTVTELPSRYMTLDIAERCNASELSGGGSVINLPTGGEVVVQGVPFRLPPMQKNNHVDLSMSWMEAAMRCGYGETEVWTRWRAATDKVPLRYQFRVPFDNYDTLYVLATSDDRKDAVPRFTAQFYLPKRGRPVNFASPDIPAFDAKSTAANAFPVKLANGKSANLYMVKIKLEPGQFVKFSKSPFFDMELTKDVQTYRAYPDPLTHSIHGAGLPSSVRVFGITFGRSPLKTTFDPDALSNIWTEGNEISYTVKLENITTSDSKAKLTFSARSYDGSDEHAAAETVSVNPGETKELKFKFTPKKFGYYNVALAKEYHGEKQTFTRTLAHLRKREYGARPFDHKGMFFGCWHVVNASQAKMAGLIGLDLMGLNPNDDEARAVMNQYGMKDPAEGSTARVHVNLKGKKNENEDLKILLEKIPSLIQKPDDIHNPIYSAILCEPGGIGTGHACFGEYYGEAPFDYAKLDEKKKARYEDYKYSFMTVRKALKQLIPNTKIMLPNGSWTFTIPFLQDPDTRNLMDGVVCDYQFYTRLPEQQMHQCSIHSMYYFQEAWKKYRPGETPLLVFNEGPDISQVYPGAMDEERAAAHRIRCSVIMAGYGANHQMAWGTSIDQSGGENHCSGGFLDNEVSLNPELSCSAFAAHTRHTRDAIFESFTNPGSFSAYCANFRNHKTGKLLRIIWNIRGTRELIIDAKADRLEVYDAMDNIVRPEGRDGKSVLKVGQIPIYVYGTDENTAIALGAIDHGDSKLGKFAKKLGNAAELFTEQNADADSNYVEMMPEYIKRFQTKMEIGMATIDAQYGGQALSITLPKQEKDRGLMPYYTCLKLKKPMTIAGKGSHILIWVKANSDWGRIVYVLRDASGKQWYSVGLKGTWNADDMPGDSSFCFDGWRLLRYELPANAPWDSFRELGMTRWGSDNQNSLVELPLSLEKIFVERRSSVMYGNGQCRINQEQPVLLGDIYVEYAKEPDMTDEVIRLSKIRVPDLPIGSLPNPISEMKKSGTLAAGKITGIKDPDTWFDGTRGIFSFEMPANAVSADIWMSLYPDGKGALKQGKGLKQSPAKVEGFLADTEFYAFLVYKDKEGQTSVPSEPFKFKMIDHFGHQ